ncbi:MAG: DNA internalization-related competence protein ComEC/Rec2 [Candidatus Celaenobacter polaris]|nr:DNA internalization-related competence protein ComEC/Rec2 [Candidatus Celaenobacter polaris]
MRNIFNHPFIPITTCFIAGLLLGSFFSVPILHIAIALLFAATFLLIHKKRPLFPIIGLVILFGIFRFQISQLQTEHHIAHFIDHLGIEKVQIEGQIIEEPEVSSDKITCIVKLTKLEGVPVLGNIRLTIKDKYSNAVPSYGDHICYNGTIFRPLKSNNPYSFNYREYLENNNIHGLSYLYKSDYTITNESKNLYYYLIVVPRNWIRARIDRFYSSKYSGFLKAILLGEKSSLPLQLRQDFASSGLSHILAVSGLHTGVIALIFLTIFQIVLRNRTAARILTIILLMYYMLLAHAVPSVQRAVIMISLVLLAKILQRRISTINILFAAAFIILVINPLQLFSIGFQLSFISVFAILVIFQYLSQKLNSLRKNHPKIFWLLNLVLLSLMVQIVLAPLTIHYFHTLALGGIIANVIAIPLISLALPLSIFSILFPISAICAIYAAANKLLLFIVFAISRLVAIHRILLFDFLYMSEFQIIALYAVLLFLILLWKNTDNTKIKLYKFLSFSILTASILIVPGLLLERNLEITVLDVGQGDAIVIRTPDRKTILIDTGDKTMRRDYGELVVVPYFKARGIKEIALLVLTHPHADHIGGAQAVMNNLKIDKVLLPRCDYESQLYDNVLTFIDDNDIEIIYADTSLVFEEFEAINLKILHPTYEYKNEANVNNYSIVIKIEYGDLSVLFTGDAEKEVEAILVENWGNKLDSDLLKVGHHGSNSSSTLDFLEYVSPEYAVISVGTKNRYDHPDEEIVERLDSSIDELFRTDQDGAVIFLYGGNTLKIKTMISEREVIDCDI